MSTSPRHAGLGRVLVAVYGVLAIAALGRSIFQIIDRFDEAPIAFTLSAVAAAVYVVATLALAFGWDRVAWVTITFELVGVLVIGTISLVAPAVLGLDEINPFGREATVWSVFGAGYLFIPLALPILGILWLRSKRTGSGRGLMEFYDDVAEVPADFGPSVVTVGKFDGVHLGHRAVLDAVRAAGEAAGLVSTVVTFDRHPLSLFAPEKCPVALVSNRQKVELLADAGVDATLMLRFDRELAAVSAEDFVRRILVDTLHARIVFAGADFRFGAKAAGDVALLRTLGAELGFEVRMIEDVSIDGVRADDAERRTSSTWARELLEQGRVREAAAVLGRPHSIRSTVVHGDARGRDLGFPTANLAPELEGFLPADGVYATWAVIDGVRYPAATSIGNNPTFEGVPEHRVEAYLIDQDVDLYGKEIELEFVDYVRPMNRFDSVDALVAQLGADVGRIRAILGRAESAAESQPPRIGW